MMQNKPSIGRDKNSIILRKKDLQGASPDNGREGCGELKFEEKPGRR